MVWLSHMLPMGGKLESWGRGGQFPKAKFNMMTQERKETWVAKPTTKFPTNTFGRDCKDTVV